MHCVFILDGCRESRENSGARFCSGWDLSAMATYYLRKTDLCDTNPHHPTLLFKTLPLNYQNHSWPSVGNYQFWEKSTTTWPRKVLKLSNLWPYRFPIQLIYTSGWKVNIHIDHSIICLWSFLMLQIRSTDWYGDQYTEYFCKLCLGKGLHFM